MTIFVKEYYLFSIVFLYFFVLILFLGILYRKSHMKERLNNLTNYQNDNDYINLRQSNIITKLYRHKLDITQKSLEQAGIKASLTHYLLFRLMITISLALINYLLTGSLIIVLASYVICSQLFKSILKTMKKKRIIKCTAQLPTIVRLVGGMITTGSSPLKALSDVTSEIDEPMKTEFDYIVKSLNLGLPYKEVFENLYQKVPSPDVQLFVNAMIIQRETGANLGNILSKMELMLIEGERIKNEQKALVAQGKLSAVVLTFMPYVVAVLIWLFNPGFLSPLFSGIGLYILIYGVISSIFGWLVIMKIVEVDY